MKDDIVVMVQAWRLGRLLKQAALVPLEAWSRYVRTGSTVGGRDVVAYVHSALVLPAVERGTLARITNELTAHLDRAPAPYCCQLWDRIRMARRTANGEGQKNTPAASWLMSGEAYRAIAVFDATRTISSSASYW